MGKTRLVRDLTSGLGSSARTVMGGCTDLGVDGPPFGPFVTALRRLVRAMGADRPLVSRVESDLFEACSEAVADRVSWVEAWYYHVRLGSIHCGTNVLRTAPAGLRWWR